MPTIAVNGTQIHYEERGRGVPIVFSHGLLWSGRMYAPQMAALGERYRCIAYDHRGQGLSPSSPVPYDMDLLADDAAALIEKLEARPCHFVGLSMGGFVGLRLALGRPELLRSLTLIDSAADGEPRWNVVKYKVMVAIARRFGLRVLVPAVMPIMFGRTFLRDRARSAERDRLAAELAALAFPRVLPALESVVGRQPLEERLGQVRVPTLVLHGEEDRAIVLGRARRAAQGIDGARLVVLPRAGHTSSLEEPDAVTRELARFLDDAPAMT